jgi:hypothetical protein
MASGRTRASVARRADGLIQKVLEQEEAVVSATPPEKLSKLDPALGRPCAALDAAAYWVALNRTPPRQHEREIRAEWDRRRGQASAAEVRCALRRIEGRASAAATLVGGRGRVALHKSWGELTSDEQEAAESLGWWKQAWAEATAPTVRGTRTDGLVATWADLRPEQEHAARVLGLDAQVWELLAAADATAERRNRAEAAAAAAAAQMSDSESDGGGHPVNQYDSNSSDAVEQQALSDITEEDDGSRYNAHGRDESLEEGDGDDAPSAQTAAVEQAAERMKAELCERRAANLALQEEASQPVVDPPWRGHSSRAGWTVVRPRQSSAADSTGHSRRTQAAAAREKSRSEAACMQGSGGPPLTPRTQPAEDGSAMRRRRRLQRQQQQAHGEPVVSPSHRRNATAWLEKRSARQSSAQPNPQPPTSQPVAAQVVAAAALVAKPGEQAPPAGGSRPRSDQPPPSLPRCRSDDRVWVRSAVASLLLE